MFFLSKWQHFKVFPFNNVHNENRFFCYFLFVYFLFKSKASPLQEMVQDKNKLTYQISVKVILLQNRCTIQYINTELING
jgi:hypothetical protein